MAPAEADRPTKVSASIKNFKRQHCKSLKPVFEKLAADFASEPSVVVAQYDADDARNKAIANRYGVKSYPTLKFFPRGKKAVDFVPTAYEAARTEQAFVDFINEHAGTARTVGGGLSALVRPPAPTCPGRVGTR
jgi:protein disulfide-isomerase A6